MSADANRLIVYDYPNLLMEKGLMETKAPLLIPPFSSSQERALLMLAGFGLLVPNGIFIYFSLTQWPLVVEALSNSISLVFIVEAFVLMFLFSWLIHRAGIKSPSWLAFILMSIAGSLMFSVPAFLYLAGRSEGR